MYRCNSISWWILKLIFRHSKIKKTRGQILSEKLRKLQIEILITNDKKNYADKDELVLTSTVPSGLPKYALKIILMNKPVSTTPGINFNF